MVAEIIAIVSALGLGAIGNTLTGKLFDRRKDSEGKTDALTVAQVVAKTDSEGKLWGRIEKIETDLRDCQQDKALLHRANANLNARLYVVESRLSIEKALE